MTSGYQWRNSLDHAWAEVLTLNFHRRFLSPGDACLFFEPSQTGVERRMKFIRACSTWAISLSLSWPANALSCDCWIGSIEGLLSRTTEHSALASPAAVICLVTDVHLLSNIAPLFRCSIVYNFHAIVTGHISSSFFPFVSSHLCCFVRSTYIIFFLPSQPRLTYL